MAQTRSLGHTTTLRRRAGAGGENGAASQPISDKHPPSESPSEHPTTAPAPQARRDQVEVSLDSEGDYEFGGPAGVAALMVTFPLLMIYLFTCLDQYEGKLVVPTSEFITSCIESVMPNWYAFQIYVGFAGFQLVMASTLPGVVSKGLPVPSLNGQQLEYLCNGVASFYVDFVVVIALHKSRIFPLTDVVDNFGPLMTVSILSAFFITVATYVTAIVTKSTHRMSGNVIYDMFMGAILNPRIGNVDLKMWSEIRIPWKILFFVSLSAAVKEHEARTAMALEDGMSTHMELLGGAVSLPIIRTSAPLIFMTLAHFLYVNACMKGEECILPSWDIFYEKWGFMLIFWNMSGVPFTYGHSTLYLLSRSLDGKAVEHSSGYTIALFVILLSAYYVWDTANSQKNRFRAMERGTYVKRYTFPQLPWGTLENPSYIQTKRGTKLLTGGWWGVARKIHYTADLVMALSWGLISGFDSFIPYFYFCFFVVVLTHRASRDVRLCKEKYEEDWDEYCRIVPYLFIPFVF